MVTCSSMVRLAAVVAAGVLGGAGCRLAPRAGSFCPIAVWYRPPTEDLNAGLPRAAEDLATMADLGFNTVVLTDDHASDVETLGPLGATHGLGIVAPDAYAATYVGTGRMPPQCWWPWALAWHVQNREGRVVSFGAVADAASARRAVELAAWQRRRREAPASFAVLTPGTVVADAPSGLTFTVRSPCDVGGSNPTPNERVTVGNLAEITVWQPHPNEDEAVGDWLADFHRALMAGQTAGVVFNGFRSPSPAWEGIISERGDVSAKRAATVKRIIRRAGKWCPRLSGTVSRRLPPEPGEPPSIEVVLFTGEHRRLLMVWNASATQFVRDPVCITAPFVERPADRLVTVPVDDLAVVGEVFAVRRGRVNVPTELAPGDARLFEIF